MERVSFGLLVVLAVWCISLTSGCTGQPTLKESASPFPNAATQGLECEAQGIGVEKDFAEKVCKAATKFGLHPELVHSFGAGGVDIFISKAAGNNLVEDKAKLTKLVKSLTEWSKNNYSNFNAVEITIVAGDSKIARGGKIGTLETTIILY